MEARPFVVQMVAEAEAKAVSLVMDEALARAAAAVVSMAVANAVAADEARAAEAAMPMTPPEDDKLEETVTSSSLEGGRLEASMTTLAPAAEKKLPFENFDQAVVGCTTVVLSWLTQTLCGKQLMA